jgi:hypothetical protein
LRESEKNRTSEIYCYVLYFVRMNRARDVKNVCYKNLKFRECFI